MTWGSISEIEITNQTCWQLLEEENLSISAWTMQRDLGRSPQNLGIKHLYTVGPFTGYDTP